MRAGQLDERSQSEGVLHVHIYRDICQESIHPPTYQLGRNCHVCVLLADIHVGGAHLGDGCRCWRKWRRDCCLWDPDKSDRHSGVTVLSQSERVWCVGTCRGTAVILGRSFYISFSVRSYHVFV